MGRVLLVATLATSALSVASCGGDEASDVSATSTRPESTASSTTPGDGTGRDTPVTGDAIPPEVGDNADDWPLPGRDYRNSRNAESAIDSRNVDSLEVAWEAPLPGSGVFGNLATTPLIVGDTVYVEDLTSSVHAIDRETGEVRWSVQDDAYVIGPNGVALGWGRVYAVDGTDGVVALDAATGDEVWRRTITTTGTEGIDIQPTVFGGLVLVSTVPISIEGQYAGGDRGVLHALDAETGDDVWTFDTVDSEDLWGNPDVNSGGGAWYPPSIDAERGAVYWGVANPAPFPGTEEFPNGTSRPGPNLYTDSVVALDVQTGEMRWYRQAVEHDLFDRDLVHTMIVSAGAGDGAHDVVVGTGKLGRVIGHDPETGEALWDTPVGVHRNDDLDALEGPTEILPGTYGGVLTPPASADGVVYVPTVNAPTELGPSQTSLIGAALGTMNGQLVAVDASNGEIVWDTEIPGDPLGAATVVNDLVLTATFQGHLYALDRETGEIVMDRDLGGGINGWLAAAGDTLIVPVGMAEPPHLLALRLPRP